jgi:RNA polymerase sigma-70 factor (ECF subfamily)
VEIPVEQLITTLKAGDITAFEMLFRTYYQPLCNYAFTYIPDRDEAEEIVQSTFLNVWEKRENLAIHTGVKPYLYAMVRNACLNAIQHEKVRQQHAAVEMAEAKAAPSSSDRG